MEKYDEYYKSIIDLAELVTNTPDNENLRNVLLTMCMMFLEIVNPIIEKTEDTQIQMALGYLAREVQETLDKHQNSMSF